MAIRLLSSENITGDITVTGKILVGTGATAAASLNAFTQTVSSNLFSALRIIENSGASSYWDIGAIGGASTLLNFYHNSTTTPKISFTHLGGATFAGDVAIGGAVVAGRNLAIYNTNADNEIEFIGAAYTNIYSNTNSTMALEVIGDGALRLATKGGSLTIATGGSSTFTGNVTLDNILLTPAVLPAVNTPSISLRSTNNEVYFQAGSANVFNFMKADYTTMLALDGSTSATFAGNVGIGITPNVNSSVVDVLQLGKGMTIMGNVNDDRATMGANLYLDVGTAFRYVMDGYAGRFSIEDGQMIWGVSAIGNAGDVATVNTKMTLLNNGNLGIGTGSPNYKLSVANANTRIISATYIDGANGIMSHAGAPNYGLESFQVRGDFISFWTDYDPGHYQGTEKMRIDQSGNVGIDAIPETGMVTYVKQLRLGEQSAFQGHAAGVGQDSATWLTTNYKFTTSGTVFINGTAATPGYANFYQQQLGDHSFGCSPSSGVAGAATGSRIQLMMKQSGNVGIGETDPDSKLHVKGDMVTIEDPSGGFKMELSADANPVTIMSDNMTGAAYGEMAFNAGNGSGANDQTRMHIDSAGDIRISKKVAIGSSSSPNTKLDVSGATGTRNRNTQGSSVYETSITFNAAGNATTNVSIDTATAFPPIASGGFILVEVSASGYGNSGSNGLIFSYISGGYGGHYGGQGQPYHPVEIIANTMQAGSCAFYYPNSTTVGIAVTTTNSAGLSGVMRVKVTTTY